MKNGQGTEYELGNTLATWRIRVLLWFIKEEGLI